MGVVFFPRITNELVDSLGVETTDYHFFFELGEEMITLSSSKKGGALVLEDDRDIWALSQDGLCFDKIVDIDHPELLFGADGVVPSDAYAALCIVWTCKALSQTGVIYPCSGEYGSDGVHVSFRHRFAPGDLKDDLTLELTLYLKEASRSVVEGEDHLMNEAGALLGVLEDPCAVSFKGNVMPFPLGEIHSSGDPLWWVEFSDWNDPRSDQFNDDNILLILNKAHKDYSAASGGKGLGKEVLREIFAAAIFLMMEKVREFDDPEPWQDMVNNVTTNFEPGSICGVLHQVSQMDPDAEFVWVSSETRMASIKRIVDRRMGGDM